MTNFVDRVIEECVEARIEAQRHGVANYGVYVTCTNEHGDAMHQVFGTVDDSGSIMLPWPENVLPVVPEMSTEECHDMSVVLSLLPVYRMDSPSFCLTVLEVAPAPDLLQELGEIPGLPVPGRFNSYLCQDDSCDESHYGNTQKTGTGEPLQMASVRELLRFSDHSGVYEEPQNRAVWAYLRELLEESMVALYWD